MTKIFNAIIVVLMIALIAVFIVSAVSLQSNTDKILTSYSVKREELATKQQQLQDMIVSLNSTLQSEVEKQQVIAAQLGLQLNSTVSAPTPIVTTTPAPVVTPAPIIAPPQPVPTPRITRAS